MQGYPVIRAPEELHLHPALARLNLSASVIDSNRVRRPKVRPPHEPILITKSGTIISGFLEWHDALSNKLPAVDCIEYPLNDNEAIQLILGLHQSRRVWNDFTSIRLALELEPDFQAKALANQIAGGKYKGSANLPSARHIDVRQEIALAAGVSARNVGNVKTILKKASPRLIEALQTGSLTIHRALQLCRLPWSEQVEQFACHIADRSNGKVIRQSIQASMEQVKVDFAALLLLLQQQEAQEPGSVVVQAGERKQTIILLSRNQMAHLRPQTDMEPA